MNKIIKVCNTTTCASCSKVVDFLKTLDVIFTSDITVARELRQLWLQEQKAPLIVCCENMMSPSIEQMKHLICFALDITLDDVFETDVCYYDVGELSRIANGE
jgi:hypothetical protein